MRKLAVVIILFIGILAAGCQSQPVTPGSYSFANWPTGKTGRLKFEGQVYDSSGGLLRTVKYADVAVDANGKFSYSLSTPAAADLSTFNLAGINPECKVSDRNTKYIAGTPSATYQGISNWIPVVVANKDPNVQDLRNARWIHAAVYPDRNLTVTGKCKNPAGVLVTTNIAWTGKKWNYYGVSFDANTVPTVVGTEKLGDSSMAAYLIEQPGSLSTQSIGYKAQRKPLAFIR